MQNSLSLAQLEGAMVTLQQYSSVLANQTEAEAISNQPEEPTEVEVEEEQESENVLSHDDLLKRSSSYRKVQNTKKGSNSES